MLPIQFKKASLSIPFIRHFALSFKTGIEYYVDIRKNGHPRMSVPSDYAKANQLIPVRIKVAVELLGPFNVQVTSASAAIGAAVIV